MKSPIYLYSALVIGVLSLSTSAIFVKLAAAPSAITAFYRLFITAVILLPFLLFNKNNRQEIARLSKKQWLLGTLSGLFLAVHYVLWFESLRYTSVASSTVLVTLQPLFAITAGYFLFKEKYSKRAIIGCLTAIAGCFVIGWSDFQISGQALFGDLLAFIAAGIISAYFLVGQLVRKDLSLIPYCVLGYLSSSVFLALYALVLQVPFAGYSPLTWKAFLGLAIIPTILGQLTFNWLLKWLPASVISMSILGETIGTCILAYFILHESILLQQGIGIIIIFAGLALFFLKPRKEPLSS